MSDDPMAAALARLHAEHPDLPTDGGRVWEPVQDDDEDEEAPTLLELAEVRCETPSPDGKFTCLLARRHDGLHADKTLATITPNGSRMVWETPVASTPLVRAEQAVAADRAAILREAANALACLGPEDSLVSAPKAWNEAVETLRRMADEAQPTTPADACQLHSPTGDPCGCGHAAGADCHPRWMA